MLDYILILTISIVILSIGLIFKLLSQKIQNLETKLENYKMIHNMNKENEDNKKNKLLISDKQENFEKQIQIINKDIKNNQENCKLLIDNNKKLIKEEIKKLENKYNEKLNILTKDINIIKLNDKKENQELKILHNYENKIKNFENNLVEINEFAIILKEDIKKLNVNLEFYNEKFNNKINLILNKKPLDSDYLIAKNVNDENEENKKNKKLIYIGIFEIEKTYNFVVRQRYMNDIKKLLQNEEKLIKNYLFLVENLIFNQINVPLFNIFEDSYLHESGNLIIVNNTLHLLTNKTYSEKTNIERIFYSYFYADLNLDQYQKFYVNNYATSLILHNYNLYEDIPFNPKDTQENIKIEITCLQGIKYVLLKRKNEFKRIINDYNIINEDFKNTFNFDILI